jgi:hypothetical protein
MKPNLGRAPRSLIFINRRARWRHTAAALSARAERPVTWLILGLSAVYVAWFTWLQLDGAFQPMVTEWDCRANTLVAYRWHGRGLFKDDLLVDFVGLYGSALWRAIYWTGTLLWDARTVSKIVPLFVLPFLVWQGFQLGRRFGGAVVGGAVVILLLHCHYIWGRIAGGNARAFGIPLVVALLRYQAEGRERATLLTIVAMALGYPSDFLFCAPAYALTLGWPRLRDRRWQRFTVVAGLSALFIWWSARSGDPRIGHPIHYDELMTIKQKGVGGLFPILTPAFSIQYTLKATLWESYGHALDLWRAWGLRKDGALALLVCGFILGGAGRALARLPRIYATLLLASLAMYFVALAAAYRLYFPDRMLLFCWPPLILTGLPIVAWLALSKLTPRWAPALALLATAGFQLLVHGDGLSPLVGLHDWKRHDTPVVRFSRTLPAEATIAAPPGIASDIQAWGLRKVVFSNITNVPHHYPFALELEERIGDWLRAYYARDVATIKQFAQRHKVDYMVIDVNDFGPAAHERIQKSPWTELARSLVDQGPPDELTLAHVPDGAVVFRSGSLRVIDLHKL